MLVKAPCSIVIPLKYTNHATLYILKIVLTNQNYGLNTNRACHGNPKPCPFIYLGFSIKANTPGERERP